MSTTTVDPTAAVRAAERARESAEAQESILATAFETPLPEPVAEPFPSNDAALAASLNEWKQKDVAYQRARTETDRMALEAQALENIRQNQQREQFNTARIELGQAQQQSVDDRNDAALLEQAAEFQRQLVRDGLDQLPAEKLPADTLRQLAILTQQMQEMTARRGVEQSPIQPKTFPDGKFVHMSSEPDGRTRATLPTGETYLGNSPEELVEQLAQSNIHTKAWGQRFREQAQQQPAPVPQRQITPPEPTQQSSIASWLADETAKEFGFSNKQEMIQWGQSVTSHQQQIDQNMMVSQFVAARPDFPFTPDAIESVNAVMVKNGWQVSADNLAAAHDVAVRERMYQPLAPEEVQISKIQSGPKAPPMIGSRSPDSNQTQNDPWKIPLSELRTAAIKQGLGAQ